MLGVLLEKFNEAQLVEYGCVKGNHIEWGCVECLYCYIYKIRKLTVFNKQPKQEYSYKEKVKNISQAPRVLGVLREKFNKGQLAAVRASYFGHL